MKTTSPHTEMPSNGTNASQSPAANPSAKPTEEKLPSCEQQSLVALPLNQDSPSRQQLAARLYRDFYAMKTYGKEPESLESIVSLFNESLANFPFEKINAAFIIHAQRSQEFPTPSDIVGLIRRNGKPPIKESDVIAIRKKDGSDRTNSDWQLLREWDDQQQEGWDDIPDPVKDQATLQENIQLRQRVNVLEHDVELLRKLLHDARMAKGFERPRPSVEEKVTATISAMRAAGATDEDITAFASEYGIAA